MYSCLSTDIFSAPVGLKPCPNSDQAALVVPLKFLDMTAVPCPSFPAVPGGDSHIKMTGVLVVPFRG